MTARASEWHETSSRRWQRHLISEIVPAHGVGDETVESRQECRHQFDELVAALRQSGRDPALLPGAKACGHGARPAEAVASLINSQMVAASLS